MGRGNGYIKFLGTSRWPGIIQIDRSAAVVEPEVNFRGKAPCIYLNSTTSGFPIIKSWNPKSVVRNGFALNTLVPSPGMAG